jgi:hypothetical protein
VYQNKLGGCVIVHHSAGMFTGHPDGPVSIVDDQFFSERIDIMLDPATEFGKGESELNGISNTISPRPPLVLITSA